ncbi:putative cytosol alanyl aminopeptidase [Helianthus annuus]|uniref:Cytosol alanyl aminopeptidase n=1 Tax=Helianthus annuus TaxID=4232 RepID=A0A9K3EJF7_HELAN|nr:putative cytosol alanyl aminopeptidase [Helianthus annuus]KAJ0478069.1 putative cytosol alanyl aminopeptidase [Helianthus annuus]KAJ0498947.1 putative cytosol alanyl aminopeptidase [Helianthus annuus]KAJ0664962.1 putative cytosol alanyl aminopeptidase [Helianthus annuus]KAJ0672382.1 putative cytosol alanyl aminopeptidase [Helianthus annuus]
MMARLIIPCKGSSLPRTCLLGLISSAHIQGTSRASSVKCANTLSKYRHYHSSQIIHRSCRFPYHSLPRTSLTRTLIRSVATEPAAKSVEEPKMDAPKEIFLKDYKLPEYYFDTVDLSFSLGEEKTIVSAKISIVPRVDGAASPLVLDGVDLKLISVKINGNELKEGDFHLDARHLILTSPPSGNFILETVTEILPQKNTSLEGLYKSSGNFCTQCEAEGFRKITFYQDRPDIMAKYTCRIEADKSLYPVLLSNGNLIEQGDLEGGKHFALWEDPFKKPCYLFALVAGQLESRDDTFTTCSGRKVALRIWTPPEDLPKTEHAMYSLKAAMKWDEEVYGREYDLDIFNIVSVPDFNMGAMENKSLNIFNSKLVLASPETATDADYAAILGVIGHEYFHNWTGNRVTCRDWFQLSLKEGLTVFRDQEFSSDLGSRTVKRIGDVSKLRIYQFSQDAGPMAHPVRPHSYIKVYEKGAEVVRMYKTLLGSQGFRKGTDLYFQRHDGQAVTCEDFFAAMRDANDADFANFLLWYSQAGTPVVKVTSSYNAEAHTFSLKFSQTVPPTPGQPIKEPMFIPVAAGLLDSNGKDMPLSSIYHDGKLESVACGGQPVNTTVLRVTKAEEEFVFTDVPEKPIPSLLRGYSAPIRLHSDLTDNDLFFLLAHDSDEFNRWEAGQILARNIMLSQVVNFQKDNALVLDPQFVHGIKCILLDSSLDKEFIAKAITLPGEGEIMDMMEVADPDAVHAVRKFIRKQLASELKQELINLVKENRSTEKYVFDHANMARRALKNTALGYLASLEDEEITELVLHEYKTATNMTDQFSALAAIAQKPGKARDDALADFYNQWQHDYLVVNKWFALQSSSDIPGNVENVHKLLSHPAFDLKNPNKVYSLIGGFCASPVNFHAKDGSGYKFLGEIVVQLDKLNPQVASRMVSAFSRWKRYDETRQNLAKAQLEMIVSANGLSENVYEIASKSLAV